MAMCLVDTNVMLAASAVHDMLSDLAKRAMPQEIELREIIYLWLAEFSGADEHIVLDEEGLIRAEYERNMRYNPAMYEQEYGMQVLQNKIDRYLCDYVTIDVLEGNGECIAQLTPELEALVTDREDRKWVAAAISANILLNELPPIVYGAESDWYDIEVDLAAHDVHFHRLLPEAWYKTRHATP